MNEVFNGLTGMEIDFPVVGKSTLVNFDIGFALKGDMTMENLGISMTSGLNTGVEINENAIDSLIESDILPDACKDFAKGLSASVS